MFTILMCVNPVVSVQYATIKQSIITQHLIIVNLNSSIAVTYSRNM